jgi:DNA-binding transcriptional ArsR family regulator
MAVKKAKISKTVATQRAKIVKVLARASSPTNAQVLYALIDNSELGIEEMTVGQLSENLKRPYASIYQALRDLAEHEFVEFVAEDGVRQQKVKLLDNALAVKVRELFSS